MNKRIVIIGGVAAGATAAARARRLDEHADITVIERGPYVSFANCGLPYFISGDIKKRSSLLLQTPEGFYSRYRVNVLLKTEAVGIDRKAKTVKVVSAERGEEAIAYDALILAQGGSPIVPPLPGVDLPHVFRLWTIPDMDAIQARIRDFAPKKAVVVGGGFIGLEVAEAFIERGLELTLIELADHLMPPMDQVYGDLIKERFEAAGATVLVKRAVKTIEEKRVILDDGSYIDADIVLLSVGVRPNTALAKEAGLELGSTGALLVDEYLKTNDPAIWAAGDMVEVVHKVHGKKTRMPLAGPANRQGRIVATNVLGGSSRYKGATGTSVVKIFDTTAAMTGLSLAGALREGYAAAEATIMKAHHASYYPGAEDMVLSLVYDTKNGKLLGAQAFGKEGVEKRIDVVAVALQAGLSVDDLAEMDLAYAPPYSSGNDPVNMASFVAQNAMSGFSPLVNAAQAVSDVAAGKAVFVDVRTLGEYNRKHAKGALTIPVDEIRDELAQFPTDTMVYLVSKGGFEGHIAYRTLSQSGITNVKNVSGGWAVLRLASGLVKE